MVLPHTCTRPSSGDPLDALTETELMGRACALAARAHGDQLPNPKVGCVIARDGVVLGAGFHARAGGPHAEVAALRDAAARGHDVAGATAVVTLEPCNHTGRTGPCSHALAEAGIGRVVFAVPDPTATARGGAAYLRARGIPAERRPDARAEAVNETWLLSVRRSRTHLTWKFAATLDGRSAAADGTSRWITSPEARADVHRLRAECDAIIAGAGTVLADDPWLTVRDGDLDAAGGQRLAARQPLRVVVDPSGRVPATARALDDAAPSWTARTRDPALVLGELYGRGCRAALLEGGPTLAGAFLAAGLVDRVVAYLAPALLGAGPASLGPAGITSMSGIRRLEIDEVARVGPDVRITAHPLHDSPIAPFPGTPAGRS